MLAEVELKNFKAFEEFTATFGRRSYVVGPNSAGKSTLLSAVRLANALIQQATRMKLNRSVQWDGASYVGYHMDAERAGLVAENLRHDFRDEETSVVVRFSQGSTVTAVWPREDVDDPFFFLSVAGKPQPRTTGAIRPAFPTVAVVPMLAPLERTEVLLDPSTVKRNWGGRLSSRHFRNQLNLLDPAEMKEFHRFVSTWTPELDLGALEWRHAEKGVHLDLFFTEKGHRSLKEVCWAGDGMQVWLQVLHHVHSNRDAAVLVLDEPDIYLHADLQRRLVRLLDSCGGQTILASHSSEVLGEAATEDVAWVDKSRRATIRGSDGLALSAEAIGSQFNLRMARAVRSELVVFLDDDVKLFQALCRSSGSQSSQTRLDSRWSPSKAFTTASTYARCRTSWESSPTRGRASSSCSTADRSTPSNDPSPRRRSTR